MVAVVHPASARRPLSAPYIHAHVNWPLFEADCVAAIKGSVESTVNWSRLCMTLQGGRWGTTGHHNDILKIVCRSLLVSRVTERHLVPCFNYLYTKPESPRNMKCKFGVHKRTTVFCLW